MPKLFIIAAFLEVRLLDTASVFRSQRIKLGKISAFGGEDAESASTALRDGLHDLLQRGETAVENVLSGHPAAAYDMPRERRQTFKEHSAICLLLTFTVLVWITLTGAAAHLYRNTKQWPDVSPGRHYTEPEEDYSWPRAKRRSELESGKDPAQVEADFKEFRSGPFDCMQDCSSCCWATWCPCIRWADNMGMVGIIGYWVGISIFCGMVMLNVFSFGVILWFFASLLWMSFRQKLRRRFGMEHGSAATYFSDWFLYLCCCCCAISQEARHIEEAGRAGHRVVSKPKDLEEKM